MLQLIKMLALDRTPLIQQEQSLFGPKNPEEGLQWGVHGDTLCGCYPAAPMPTLCHSSRSMAMLWPNQSPSVSCTIACILTRRSQEIVPPRSGKYQEALSLEWYPHVKHKIFLVVVACISSRKEDTSAPMQHWVENYTNTNFKKNTSKQEEEQEQCCCDIFHQGYTWNCSPSILCSTVPCASKP